MHFIPLTPIPLTSPRQNRNDKPGKVRGIVVRGIRCIAQKRNAFVWRLVALALTATLGSAPADSLQRLKYNNPGLVVDLGAGLWAWPLPMDFDGDGDLDLVVSWPALLERLQPAIGVGTARPHVAPLGLLWGRSRPHPDCVSCQSAHVAGGGWRLALGWVNVLNDGSCLLR